MKSETTQNLLLDLMEREKKMVQREERLTKNKFIHVSDDEFLLYVTPKDNDLKTHLYKTRDINLKIILKFVKKQNIDFKTHALEIKEDVDVYFQINVIHNVSNIISINQDLIEADLKMLVMDILDQFKSILQQQKYEISRHSISFKKITMPIDDDDDHFEAFKKN